MKSKFIIATTISLAMITMLGGCAASHPMLTQATISDASIDASRLKSGESCGGYIFGIFGPLGGKWESIQAAMTDGNLEKVISLEQKFKNYFVYAEKCIVTTGY